MVVQDELAGSLGMKVIIQLPTNTHMLTLEPSCGSRGPVPVGRDTLRLATHCMELLVGGLVGCERVIFFRGGEWWLH